MSISRRTAQSDCPTGKKLYRYVLRRFAVIAFQSDRRPERSTDQ